MPVKLNTAAILREGARIQKAEEEEMKKYSIHALHSNEWYTLTTGWPAWKLVEGMTVSLSDGKKKWNKLANDIFASFHAQCHIIIFV